MILYKDSGIQPPPPAPNPQDVLAAKGGRYRYGFNGKEKDDELKGMGYSYDYGARMYDSRLGRWLSVDPLATKYPDIGVFTSFLNNPIFYLDPDGKDVIGGNKFMKNQIYTSGFEIITQSDVALGLINKFASNTGNLYTTANPGALSRHNLNFNTKAEGDYGLTTLMVINDKGKAEKYNPKMKIDENTQFQIDIGVEIGVVTKASKGDAGFAAGIINHEIFVHAENYANLLSQWEDRDNNGMTVEQFQSALNSLEDSAEKEHEEMRNGKMSTFIGGIKEVGAYFDSIINSEVSSDEKDTARANKKAFIEISKEDYPGLKTD